MASQNDEQNDTDIKGVRKRDKSASASPEPQPEQPEEEDGVVRAPQAPTTAPMPSTPSEEESDSSASGDSTSEQDSSDDSGGSQGFQFGDNEATMDDFAAMLDGDGGEVPERRRFEIGDSVSGKVVEIGSRYIFVDIGRPDEAMLARGRYEDEEGNLEIAVGDEDVFYVVGFDGGVEIAPELGGGDNAMQAIESAYQSGAPVSGTVVATNKGGFEVEIGGVRAFCPMSQIELGYTEDPEIHVEKEYQFGVSEIDDDGRSVVLSRRQLLEEEQAERREQTMKNLEVGDTVEGLVTRVADFGAFVDIGGIEGLVHVSELSHVYFDNPSEAVQVGDNVTAEVLEIEDKDADSDDGSPLRISLSMKEAEDDPWLEVNEQFAMGEETMGTVVRLAPFGAFVELLPGVEGLVHVSEMSRTEHVSTPDEVVDVGDEVQVEIQDIDIMNKRVSLSMAAAEDDPWNEVNENYARGLEVTGVVANTEDFGVFVDLDDGITALLPVSEMNLPSEVTPHRKFSRGEEITARVLNVEPERQRMALTLKSAADIGPDSGKSDSGDQSSGPSSYTDDGGGSKKKQTLGTLGDLINAKKDD